MSSRRALAVAASIFTALPWGAGSLAEEAAVTMPPRKVLLEQGLDLPINKVNAKVVRVIFPQGYKTPLHTHEGPGPRYVLRGKVKIEEGGQVHEYGPGEVFWESGQWMTAENVGEGEAEMVIVELASPKPAK